MEISITRAIIFSIIKEKEPISVSNLAKEVGLSTGTTIYRYIEELKEKGFITMHKENKKRGKPTMLSTTVKGKPLSNKEREMFKQMQSLKNKLKESINNKLKESINNK